MRIVCNAVWVLVVVLPISGVVAERARGQREVHAGPSVADEPLTNRNLGIQDCSPAPCVITPVQPSTNAFSANAAVAANPQNPTQLLVGSNDAGCPGIAPGLYYSGDGGSSWQQHCLPAFVYKGNEYLPINQPTVGYDSRGTAYVAGQYELDDDFSSGDFVAFERSTDGGRTWSAPAPAAGHNHVTPGYSRLAVDASFISPWADSVYVVSVFLAPIDSLAKNQLMVSHSGDGGRHWARVPLTPVEPNDSRSLSNPNLAVGPDGTVYVSWLLRNVLDRSNRAYVFFSKSADGGNTWSQPLRVATIVVNALPNAMLAMPINVPALGVDKSPGPNSGTLYVAMNTWTGTYLRVGVIRSTDGGKTWQRPVWVAPPSETHDQFFPWLSVSLEGLVGVSWMDRRNDPKNLLYQPFAAISSDGGRSFGANIVLNEAFSDPTRGGEGNGWIGDYTGNTWAGPNYFVAAWMDNSQTPDMEDVVGGIRLK